MRYVRNLSGRSTPQIKNHPIAAATNLKKGAVLSLSAGLAIAAVNNLETKILGVAETNHSGTNNPLAGWETATNIRVFDDPEAVFAYNANTITATTNSGANSVEATGIAAFSAANVLQGGYLKLASKSAGSGITDAVGTTYRITAFDATNKIFTVACGTAAANDTFLLFPPKGFKEGDFSSDATGQIVTARTNSSPMQVTGWNFDTNEVEVMARLHVYGVDNV